MTSLTIVTDLRIQFGPVRDQGHRLTCLAFSTSAVHEQAHGLGHQLSVEWLFYHAAKGAPSRDQTGLTIPEVCAAVELDGQPDDQHWPYQRSPSPRSWRLPTPPPAKVWRGIAGPVALSDISDRLDAGVPMVGGLAVGSGFARGTGKLVQNEWILDDDPEPVSAGAGHAVVVVGHGSINSSGLLLLRNSWGPRWGRHGYAWISASEVADRWMEGFELGAKP